MQDGNNVDIQNSSESSAPRLPRSFNFFIQSSRRIGMIATKALVSQGDVGVSRNVEGPTSSVRRLSDMMPRLITPKPREEAGAAAESRSEDKGRDLKKIVSQSHEVLMSSNSVFPITLFPSSVTLDRTKITITRRDFFWSSDVMSIRVEDVLNVQVSVGPLFGSLTIASRVMSTVDHFKISHLWRGDSIRLKHIIQGYVIAQHNKIDTSHLSKDDLIETLIELGHDTNM